MKPSRVILPTATLLAAYAVFAHAASRGDGATLHTVPHVDLKRYQGRWYEIARLPLHWEKKCASDVTATYTLRADGKIDVDNRCRQADGKMMQSRGTARLVYKRGSASKLKVTFFWPFAGDYWILDLDGEYAWALVGTPNRKNLWILSRTPKLPQSVIERLLASARASGFDTGSIIFTQQGS